MNGCDSIAAREERLALERFAAEAHGPEAWESLKAKCAALEQQVDGLTAQLDTAHTSASTWSRMYEAYVQSSTALHQHVSDLEKSLEQARKERDAFAAAEDEALRAQESAGMKSVRPSEAIALLAKERDAALADNAALLGILRDDGWVDRSFALTNPHPGAALLEEHRKALVRARNEVLEQAAVATDEEGCHFVASRIRALKRPES